MKLNKTMTQTMKLNIHMHTHANQSRGPSSSGVTHQHNTWDRISNGLSHNLTPHAVWDPREQGDDGVPRALSGGLHGQQCVSVCNKPGGHISCAQMCAHSGAVRGASRGSRS